MDKTRKKSRHCEDWKRVKQKKLLYSPHMLPQYPRCGHNSQSYQCRTLKNEDIYWFHKRFYSYTSKVLQDNFILQYCFAQNAGRRRPKTGERSAKTITIKYHIRRHNSGSLIPVCRNTFLDTLILKKSRVIGILKRNLSTGKVATETRGGDRKSQKFANKKEAVINFINQFKAVESHYCRGRSNRLYLSSELNISKMWRLYEKDASLNLKVKLSYFRNVFNTHFNIGFGSPRTDVCSTCLELAERIKVDKDPESKSKLLIELRVHKLRAKAFFSFLKSESAGTKIFSFDCQKNLPLPKLPDQSAYYSRQLYLYNLTVVEGSSKSVLRKNNVHSYVWNEDECLKGSNEIASAIFHRLSSSDFEGIHTVRLVADGCAGQNKNSIVIGMCCKWLFTHAPATVTKIEVVFPVTGHSFIPPDRVFAIIEKNTKKKEIIVQPEEYHEIISERSTLHFLGRDVEVLDWKTATNEVLKPPAQWHFQFKTTKRFILQRGKSHVSIRGEHTYKSDLGVSKNLCKKGKSVNLINPVPIPVGVGAKQLKLRDVNVLLTKHYGLFWTNIDTLSYYKKVLDEYYEKDLLPESEEGGEQCTPQEEIGDLLI